MTELCRFYGIIIALYSNDHGAPHIHVFYNEYIAKVAVGTGRITVGKLPAPALRMVREWIGEHRPELESEWVRARRGERIQKIAPLRAKRNR